MLNRGLVHLDYKPATGHHLNKRGIVLDLFFKLEELSSTTAHSLTSKEMLFKQHNPILSISHLPLQKFNMLHIQLDEMWIYTVARSLFLRLNKIILGPDTF